MMTHSTVKMHHPSVQCVVASAWSSWRDIPPFAPVPPSLFSVSVMSSPSIFNHSFGVCLASPFLRADANTQCKEGPALLLKNHLQYLLICTLPYSTPPFLCLTTTNTVSWLSRLPYLDNRSFADQKSIIIDALSLISVSQVLHLPSMGLWHVHTQPQAHTHKEWEKLGCMTGCVWLLIKGKCTKIALIVVFKFRRSFGVNPTL